MEIAIINFSGRENGNCRAISQTVARFHGEDAVFYCGFCSLEVHPCGKCGYECFERRSACPYLDDGIFEMYERVTGCGLAYFIVPNYCDYPNANFFLFNERGQCFFQGHQELLDKYLAVPKKFIVVSNTGRDNFIQAFAYQISEGKTPDILFLPAKSYKKVSVAGDLMTSPEAEQDVEGFCRSVR